MDPYDPSGLPAIGFRWLSLSGSALLAGALAFAAFVLRSGAFPEGSVAALDSLRRTATRLGRAGLCLGALGSILSLDVHAAAATGSDAVGALSSLTTVLAGSTWGLAWLARMFSLAGIGILTWRSGAHPVALGLCALLVLSFSQSDHGHTASSNASLAADWIHLSCAALWFGGIAVLVAGLPAAISFLPASARSGFVMVAFARFSAIAIPAVTGVILSGIVVSVAHAVTFGSMLETLYGRVVLAKIALLLPLLVLGYRHYRFGYASTTRTLVVSLSCQAVLLTIVLALSATLTGLAAPHAH